MAASGCHRVVLLAFILAINSIKPADAWDTDDLELFDLVEEVNANFYEVLDVAKTATSSEIKKAYRKKTLVLHPDKNEAADAEEQFRKLVAVYEVLKDDEKREKYNLVLENGLPDWRQPVFYYRKARKLGLLELALLLGAIVTIGQYFVLWAVYLERRLALEDFFESKKKREGRGRKKAAAMNDQIEDTMQQTLDSIPRPALRRLWPVTFSLWAVHTTVAIPDVVRGWKRRRKEAEERKIWEKEEEERQKQQMQRQLEEQELRKQKRQKARKEAKNAPVELAEGSPVLYGHVTSHEDDPAEETMKQTCKEGSWTDEDFVILSKAYIRFPGGTAKRWEKIADMVGRPVAEVTAKCKEMKGNFQMNLSSSIQGGMKNTKKTIDISDKIISTQEPDSIGTLQTDSDDGSKLRKRHKNKPVKDGERTLMIAKEGSTKPVSNTVNNTENATGAKSCAKVDVNNVPNIDSTAASKSSKKSNIPKLSKVAVANSIPPAAAAGNSVEGKPVTSGENTGSSGATKKGEDSEGWSQNQQVILELALRQYPKGTDQRWEKIADQIPGKSKEECVARFKHLADIVKQKKQQQS